MSYKSLCVVPTDWGDLRDQIFSRTGFAPSAPHAVDKEVGGDNTRRLFNGPVAGSAR